MTAPTFGRLANQNVRVYDLEQPRFQGMPVIEPHRPGYAYFLYRRHEDRPGIGGPGPRSSASGIFFSMEHAGTHIDALSHQAENQMLHGGIAAGSVTTAQGFLRHGVEEIPPIVTDGVLLDVARHRGVDVIDPDEPVSGKELEACAARQNAQITEGQVVLVRTGNGRHWQDPDRYLPGPGMDGSAARWLAGLRVVAVGADNMAWDHLKHKDSELDSELPGHILLLVRAGIYIIENLNLEELALDEVSSFTFVCTPLKLTGATGSPVRPIAIVAT